MLSAGVVWEVRPAGSGAADTNGGGFVSGGTDFSQQDAPQFTGTDLASTNGTSAAPSVTSASHSFATADVGNIIQISAGTSWTTGFYQIVSVSGGAATLDRACGTSATLSGGTWAEGGALASPGMASFGVSLASPGNIIFVKGGSYLITNATANVSGGAVSLANQSGGHFNSLVGYNHSRLDFGTAPTFTASGISNVSLVTLGQYGLAENLTLDGGSLTSVRGINSVNSSGVGHFITAKNCTNGGIYAQVAYRCRATGCSGTKSAFGSPYAYYSIAHDNTVTGFSQDGQFSGSFKAIGSLAVRNSGASSDGFVLAGVIGDTVDRCVAYGNGRHGVQGIGSCVSNSLSYGNGGFGFDDTQNPQGSVFLFNCAGGGNTSGNTSLGTSLNNNFSFVSLTGNPFVNSAATINSLADAIAAFALNTTAGAGAACRGAGYPTNLDIGAVQSAAGGGGGAPPNFGIRTGGRM